MKYEEKGKEKQKNFFGSTGFFTVIACCLVIIGAVAWFAVARYNSKDDIKDKSNNSIKDDAYNKQDDSYTENEETIPEDIIPETEMTENIVTDQPYDKPQEETPSAEQTEKNYVLPVDGNISKDYSSTALQYSQTYEDMRLHLGLDILCEPSSKVKAVSNGTVVTVDESSSLGKYVKIDHGDGLMVFYYGLDQIYLNVGDTVKTADEIGTVGSIPSECVEKSHIHIETYKNNECVSPLAALGFE